MQIPKLRSTASPQTRSKQGLGTSGETNETYIDSRYPSGLGLLPNGQPSQTTAKEFFSTAKDIFGKIKLLIDTKTQ